MAFGVTRPRLGNLVPRLYASFGIVDAAALGRLLDRLHQQPWVESKTRKLAGVECTLLEIAGLPAALSPAYCVVDDTMHIAESAGSLRALLEARAAGAPPAMAIGDTPRPRGAGVLSPAFDLRYDNAVIHRALRETWLPVMTTMVSAVAAENILDLDELPDPELVAEHLGPGRGALRRTEHGISLAMSGTIGGPALTALATIFGPALSSGITEERRWQRGDLLRRLAIPRMEAIDRACKAFVARESRSPTSLGELVAAGDLAKDRLALPGAATLEPVTHDGRELGKTSFRFYPEGLRTDFGRHGKTVRVISIEVLRSFRLYLGMDGGIGEAYGDSSARSLDEIEALAREKADGR